MVDIREKLFGIELKDQQYEAMLLSYLLKLSSFELTRKKISRDIATKDKVEDDDLKKLESAENYISDIINVIDSTIFTPCLIHYLRKYDPEKLDWIDNKKDKLIVMLNDEAKKAIEEEVKQFGLEQGKAGN